jgi:hypothetical protein
MGNCPACGTEVPDPGSVTQCPRCHLATSLFAAVREAAGDNAANDPAYLRTIGELLVSVDLAGPATPPAAPPQGLLSRPARFPAMPPVPPLEAATAREAPPITPLRDLPALPAAGTTAEMRRRVEEYFQLGRRLGLDFTDFETRAGAALRVDDVASLEVLVREMFVHLASSVAEEYESVLARRNELAQLVPTQSADVELDAIRRAISVGDLSGAQRRLVHARDELGRLEEEWEVGRILVTECDLLARTLRELGGDPGPAMGPLEEGRRSLGRGRREEGERLLARAAVALWSLLEPRFFEDLRRLRDRLVEVRSGGADAAPAIVELRNVATELRQRNFVGTLTAYHRLKAYLDRAAPPETLGAAEAGESPRPLPSA